MEFSIKSGFEEETARTKSRGARAIKERIFALLFCFVFNIVQTPTRKEPKENRAVRVKQLKRMKQNETKI